MYISVTEAQGRLLDLVRRVEAGEEVVLTHEGRTVARLAPSAPSSTYEERRAIIRRIVGRRKRASDGWPDAAHSQDFLYDDDGLPASSSWMLRLLWRSFLRNPKPTLARTRWLSQAWS